MTRRKKPPPQHNKRRQITDSAGWTHVIKGPPATIDPTSTASHLQLRGKSPTETKYTLETYLDRFRNHYLPIWKGSTCFEKLSRILEREMLPSSVAPKNDDVVITRCVCLGLGSMTAGSESSSYELAALISILELLETDKTHPIQSTTTTFFQDPIFNPVDRTILQHLGHTVVETPRAFSEIDGTTFLFAPHLECLHYATALEIATPAVCVGSDLQVYVDDGLLSSVAESTKQGSCQIFREFLERVESRPMPDFDRTSWCESTRIYWRTPREDSSGESLVERGISSMNLNLAEP